MAGSFELYRDRRNEFRFRLKAGNGEIILASEGYVRRAGAENGIQSVRKNAVIDERFERKETKDGGYMFNLKATNGQVIGTSEVYERTSGRDNGIESVIHRQVLVGIVDAKRPGVYHLPTIGVHDAAGLAGFKHHGYGSFCRDFNSFHERWNIAMTG